MDWEGNISDDIKLLPRNLYSRVCMRTATSSFEIVTWHPQRDASLLSPFSHSPILRDRRWWWWW